MKVYFEWDESSSTLKISEEESLVERSVARSL